MSADLRTSDRLPIQAFDYPFGYAQSSFLLLDGENWTVENERNANVASPGSTRFVGRWPDGRPRREYCATLLCEKAIDHRSLDCERRIAVVASGSNGSPLRLASKVFKDKASGDDRVLVAWRARLHHFDCVYSAHMTSYGSMPATLWPSSGTEIDSIVLFLTRPQLELLDKTEALGINYERRSLALDLELIAGPRLDRALAYVSIRGALDVRHPGNPERLPTPLAEIEGRRRRAQALGQRQVLEYVFRSFSHEGSPRPRDLLAMLKSLVEDRPWRSRFNAGLGVRALSARSWTLSREAKNRPQTRAG